MEFKHISVLYEESVRALCVSDNGIYVDGTLGGGGHSYGVLSQNETCSLIGIDRDKEAIAAAGERLAPFGKRAVLVNDNFCNVKDILKQQGVEKINGALLDLGVSSYQLDNAQRGFSYMHDAPLDMRMNSDDAVTARDIVNSYSAEELTRIFFDYGEEKWSKRIAEFIVRERESSTIETTGQLVEIIKAAIPKKARLDGGHPAKRVFQAIRIEVNGELKILERAIRDFADVLVTGGRIAVITFHSLEDRIVKSTFRSLSEGCTCPKEFPVCVCGGTPTVKIITKRPILPDTKELDVNSRSKSAKLRVAERL